MSNDEIFNSCQRAYDNQLPPENDSDETGESCHKCGGKMLFSGLDEKSKFPKFTCEDCNHYYWED